MDTSIRTPGSSRLPALSARLAALLAGLLALAYLLVFILLAWLRARYPFELEWVEGGLLDEMIWILQGRRVYGEPGLSLLPFTYNPVYFYLSAGLMKLLGVGFFAPRLISILAVFGTFLLIYRLVSADAGHPMPGLAAVGLYAASFRFSGAWMDLAKTDSLFIFVLLLAFWVSRRSSRLAGFVTSGLLFALAYYTKQLTLYVVLIFGALSMLESRGRRWVQWLAAGSAGLLVFWLLDTSNQGWYSFFSLDILAYHARVPDIWYFWRKVLGAYWPALALAAGYLLAALARLPQVALRPAHIWHNLSLAAALILAAWSIFFKVWVYDNAFMPACLGLALLAGWGIGQIMKRVAANPSGGQNAWVTSGGWLLVILQFGWLYYPPLAQLPSSADRAAAGRFVTRLENLPGEVFIFQHGFFGPLAGKSPYWHSVPVGDVLGGKQPAQGSDTLIKRQFVASIFYQAIAEQHYDWVVLDSPADYWLPYYVQVQELPDEFYPVTGARTRPSLLLARNPLARGGRFPLDAPVYQALLSGAWQEIDGQGRWVGQDGGQLNAALEPASSYRLVVQAAPACSAGQPAAQSLQISWNGERVQSLVFDSCSAQQVTLDLPASLDEDLVNALHLKPVPAPGIGLPARVSIQLIELYLQ